MIGDSLFWVVFLIPAMFQLVLLELELEPHLSRRIH